MRIIRRESGFTLLELLIGLALLGFILALMFGGLRLGIKSWDAGALKSEEMTRIRVFESFVRRQLSEVYPYVWKPADSQTLAFRGDPNAIYYVGFLPGGSGGRNGLYLLSLEVERSARIQRMVLKSLPISREMRDFSGMQGVEQTVLASGIIAEGVEELVFGYFGTETGQTEPRWLTHWKDPKRLPQLVRLQVRLTSGQEWPELVVALKVAGDER